MPQPTTPRLIRLDGRERPARPTAQPGTIIGKIIAALAVARKWRRLILFLEYFFMNNVMVVDLV